MLCTVVAIASVGLLETDRRITGAILDLPAETRPVAPAARSRDATRPPLVVLVTIDGLRADRLASPGRARETAPHLEALAQESVAFRIAAAQASHELVSQKSLHTGKYPATLIMEETSADLPELARVEAPREFLTEALTAVEPSLATGMRRAGYRTVGFTAGGWVSRAAGFARGFDVFREASGGFGAAARGARRWLREAPAGSSFLFLAGAHEDCGEEAHAPPADDLAGVSDRYDAGVVCMDAQLGLLFDTMRELDVYEEALIVVTSSHGEGLGERGVIGHGRLYPEELLVPLILRFPASWNVRPRASDEPVELVDVLPTLLTAVGRRNPRDLDGVSLLPIVHNGVHGRTFLVAQTCFLEGPAPRINPAERSILDPGRWHAVHDARTGTLELYALNRDPLAAIALRDLGENVPEFLEGFAPRGGEDTAGGAPLEAASVSPAMSLGARTAVRGD